MPAVNSWGSTREWSDVESVFATFFTGFGVRDSEGRWAWSSLDPTPVARAVDDVTPINTATTEPAAADETAGSDSAAAPKGDDVLLDDIEAFEQRVVELTNDAREERGLDPLEPNAALVEAAEGHAEDMASNAFVGHTGSDGSDLAERADEVNYDWAALGENVAAGQTTPEEVVAAWLASEGHRRNMLDPTFTEIGVGYVGDAGGAGYQDYWAQVFGATSSDMIG